MKFKLLIVGLIILAGLGIGLIRTASKGRQGPRRVPDKNRIAWHLQQAKQEGRKVALLEMQTADYLGGGDLEDITEAMKSYSVVKAQVIDSRTYEQNDNDLITWTKFKILEPLTELRPPRCPGCVSVKQPSDMLPLQPDEFLVPRPGGTLIKDGVELSQIEQGFPLFLAGQEYFMLISLYPSRTALTAGGPAGVYIVDAKENLKPFGDESPILKESIQRQFRNSLNEVRQQLRRSH